MTILTIGYRENCQRIVGKSLPGELSELLSLKVTAMALIVKEKEVECRKLLEEGPCPEVGGA